MDMKLNFRFATLLCGIFLCSAVLMASGPAGCYVIVEKVIFDPNEASPKQIQVWGLFALSDGKPGNGYLQPQYGYMYFKLDGGRERESLTLTEWMDLKKMAGTGSVITFAERPSWNGRLRKATDKPESPDVYPLYNGITRVSQGRGLGSIDNPAVIAQLKAAIKPAR
jgi:hypothetical protein